MKIDPKKFVASMVANMALLQVGEAKKSFDPKSDKRIVNTFEKLETNIRSKYDL